MPPEIRKYERRDREAVLALSLRAWAPVFASIEAVLAGSGIYERMHPDWRADQRAAVASALDDDALSVWVAEVDGTVAGFAALDPAGQGEGIGTIHMIAVDPDHQRHGIGTALTSFAVEWFRARGLSFAMVETGGDPGHAPARHTYEKAGFIPLPSVRYFKSL